MSVEKIRTPMLKRTRLGGRLGNVAWRGSAGRGDEPVWRCTSTVTGEEAGWGAGWRDGGLELCACGLRTAGYLSSHSYGLDGVLLPGIVLGNQAAALDLPTYLLPEAQKRMQPVA